MKNHINITSDKFSTNLSIDGRPVEYVTSMNINFKFNVIPTLHLEVLATNVSINADAQVEINYIPVSPEKAKEFYLKLKEIVEKSDEPLLL